MSLALRDNSGMKNELNRVVISGLQATDGSYYGKMTGHVII